MLYVKKYSIIKDNIYMLLWETNIIPVSLSGISKLLTKTNNNFLMLYKYLYVLLIYSSCCSDILQEHILVLVCIWKLVLIYTSRFQVSLVKCESVLKVLLKLKFSCI